MLRIATASALLWPWLTMGLLPPVESIRISDQSIPVLINTEATLVIGMLSLELPKNLGLIRTNSLWTDFNTRGEKEIAAVLSGWL